MMFKLSSLTWSVVFSVVFSAAMTANSGRAADASQGSAQDRERQLIGILRSEAPPQDKAIACKKLLLCGTKEAVPALAALLSDPELASWARIALEGIPDPAVDDALRGALTQVRGKLLIGVINSIGYRRDAQAVGGLIEKLQGVDLEVAAAAAAALGCVGGERAAQVLQRSLPSAPSRLRSDVAEGCVRCAEWFLAQGRNADAIKLYDAVRAADVPKQRMLEATRGAILARGAEGLPLLLEQLRAPDKALFGIGLRTARELPGREVTEAVAAEVERASLDRQTLLVMVLADRGDAAGFAPIRKAAQSGPKPMRLAAISALERMAVVAGVPVLLEIATEDDAELARAAKTALVRLPGKEASADLVARLPASSGKLRRVLIELAGQRRLAEALPAVVQSVQDSDQGVRSAAVGAVGLLGEEKEIPGLVQLLGKAQGAREREDIEKALLAISGRRGARCLPALQPLARSSQGELRLIALHALASVGGPEALATVTSALKDKDEAVQDEAARTLSTWAGNWPDDTGVAEPLLALAKSSQKTSHQVLGLRGYLEYVQVDKKLSEEAKVAKVKEVLPLVTRSEEKRLAISALGAAPSGGALEMLMTMAADPAVTEEAYLAILNVAGRDDLKGATTEQRRQALQTVVDKSKVDRTKRRAGEALKRIR